VISDRRWDTTETKENRCRSHHKRHLIKRDQSRCEACWIFDPFVQLKRGAVPPEEAAQRQALVIAKV
jgi:hypothetical protein